MSKLTIIGIILAVMAVFGVILVGILTAALPWGFWMGAQSAEREFDDWSGSAATGDEIFVSGRIDRKEDARSYGQSKGYIYTYEGCNSKFYCSHDIGEEGDIIITRIEIPAGSGPTSSREYKTPLTVGPNACCCLLSGSFFIIGGILFISGLVRGKKKIKTEE
jgi:hypothetical protein